jgi:hypothetical protein
MECDDLCILAPSQRCGTKCVTDSHTVCPCHREVVQVPSCCNYSRVVRKPIKIAVIDRVPAYKCVVDKVCCGCGARTNSCAATEPEAQAAVNAAAAQGILPTSAEQEVVLPVAEVSDTQATAQPAAPARASTGLMRLISIK